MSGNKGARRRLRAAVFALAGLLPFQTAFAECRADMQSVDFGSIDLLNPGSLTARATLRVTCRKTNWFIPQTFHVCLAADGGRTAGSRQISPRHMCADGVCNNRNRLAFNLYTDPAHRTVWGTIRGSQNTTLETEMTLFAGETEKSQDITVYAKLAEPLSNVGPGRYVSRFSDTATGLAYGDNGSCGNFRAIRFPFEVAATVVKNCRIDAPADIDFGTVSPVDANIAGQTSLNVACTSGTPYRIGLSPSNGNTGGTGAMRPVAPAAGNTDTVPYQLRSAAGPNGAVWGSAAAGNGVSGTGTGAAQTYGVYATVPSADYHHGAYKDTVTVQVSY